MTLPYLIRLIEEGDWPAVDEVQREAFRPEAVEDIAALRCLQRLSPGTCFVAEIGGEVVGYLVAHPWVADDLPPLNVVISSLPAKAATLFIHDLALKPAYRGQGMADALMARVCRAGLDQGLRDGGLLSIQDSRRFWERQGFVARPDLEEKVRLTLERFVKTDFVFMTRTSLADQSAS